MKTCFYTCYDKVFVEMGEMLRNSVKRFYPEIDFWAFKSPRTRDWDVNEFCRFHNKMGAELLEEYDRIISVDADHIMCNYCPDLFGDFELAGVKNNIIIKINDEVVDNGPYLNAGLTVCTNKEVWKEWNDKMEERMNGSDPLSEQNSLSYVFNHTTHKTFLLDFPDKSYGIAEMPYYQSMVVLNGELYYPADTYKKVCMFHAAGDAHKNKGTGTYLWETLENKEARNKLRLLTQ